MNNKRHITISKLMLGLAAIAMIIVLSPNPVYADNDEEIKKTYGVGLQNMAINSSVIGAKAMQILGSFLDAKQHLESQQALQVLSAESHKDYHPSQQMCQFGSFVRSVAKTEEKGTFDQKAFNAQMMAVYTGQPNASSATGPGVDMPARIAQFRTTYCDPADNNNGLRTMCDHDQSGNNEEIGAADKNRMNKDIDYSRTFATPLTLDIDLSDQELSDDEEDAQALARHLYWPKALGYVNPEDVSIGEHKYLRRRALFAINNVAHNSYSNILGMKASAARDESGAGAQSGWNYMKSMLRNFGLEDTEIHKYLGDYPSYHAQMEVLTKKIYQSPEFYTNLYDKPSNVERIGTSMEAIKLMQARDHLKSALRREMLTSLLVEQALGKHVLKASSAMDAAVAREK